jgi:hypothetical protein
MGTGYVLRLKSNEVTLNATGNTVGNASLVRIVNTGTATSVITRTSNAAAQIANCTILAGSEDFIEKLPTDTLTSSNTTTCLAVSCAFRD